MKYRAVILPLVCLSPFLLLFAVGALIDTTRAPAPQPAPLTEAEQRQAERDRKTAIVKRAYDECKEQKISDRAIFDCIRAKVL